MAVSIVAFIVLGCVLEGIPAIVLFGPLLFPIAQALGIHDVHYAMVVILAMGIGLFAPPFGVGYYAACAIGRVCAGGRHATDLGYMVALVIGTHRRRGALAFGRFPEVSRRLLDQNRWDGLKPIVPVLDALEQRGIEPHVSLPRRIVEIDRVGRRRRIEALRASSVFWCLNVAVTVDAVLHAQE